MQVHNHPNSISLLCQQWHEQKLTIGFVPTMGCLHQGHLSLIEEAGSRADRVVVSIFVNPLQFNDKNDLNNYPRRLDEDIRKLSEFEVDLLFTPGSGDLYPEGEDKVEQIEAGEIASILEGKYRPGHFDGVATVVKRLFDIVTPNLAVFGEKDFQQLLVIKQMVNRLNLDIDILGMPTLREDDGLAMSSRNLLLTQAQRDQASGLYQALMDAKEEVLKGNLDYSGISQSAIKSLNKKGFLTEYFEIRNAENLLEAGLEVKQSLVILVAAQLGSIRLIDNIRV